MKLRLVTVEIKKLEMMSFHFLKWTLLKVFFKQDHVHFNFYILLFIK